MEAIVIILKGGWNWRSSVPYMAAACLLKIIIIGCIGLIIADMSTSNINQVRGPLIVASLIDVPLSILAVKLFLDEIDEIRRGRR